MSVRIIVDSTFNLEKKFIEENNILVIPLNVIIDGQSFRDGIDVSFMEVLDKADQGSTVSTSQPSPMLFEEYFNKLKNEGATDIICMTLSSTLSGTFQAANIGKEEVTGVNIHLIDTLSTAIGAETFAHILVRDLKEGMSVTDTVNKIEKIKHNGGILMSMDNLTALRKSGRINRIKATIGNLLRVKPVIEFLNGKVNINSKARTEKAVAEIIVEKMKELLAGVKGKIHISIAYVQFIEKITHVLRRVEDEFPNVLIKVRDGITPVIAVNLGYGGFGISWCYE
ncbi:MAG: DegV family protein [Bacilli bacterium]